MSQVDPFDALRRNVSLLGRLLGDTLAEEEGAALFELEEKIRGLAKERRAGRKGAEAELRALVASLDTKAAERVARAFTHYFQLVNLAEQYHRVRRNREHGPRREGALATALRELPKRTSAEALREALETCSIELVFTAHPTEALRRTVLEKHRHITKLLDAQDRQQLTAEESEEHDRALRSEIALLWQTDEVRIVRPRVGDEVKTAAFYLEEVLSRVVPRLYEALERALSTAYGQPIPVPSLLRFGSWVGGDMDGNPNVTPEVAVDTAFALALRALNLHLKDVAELGARLSQSTRRVSVSSELWASLAADALNLPGLSDDPRTENEPYRRKLRVIEARLAATRDALAKGRAGAGVTGERGYASAREAAEDLRVIERSLLAHGGASAGLAEVRAMIRRLEVFGFHLARLDVRVPAAWMRETVRAALWLPDERELTSQDLESALASPRTPARPDTQGMRAMEALGEIRRRTTPEAAESFILSMARGTTDLRAALVVARIAGLYSEDPPLAAVSVVPLFETLDDLARCPHEMDEAFGDPLYRRYLKLRGDAQEVMIGYSDSNKDAGILAASYALYKAQRALTAIAKKHGVALTIFHGRGGSIGRGGGPAQRAILGLPPGSLGGRFKLTEQGEVLGWKYLLPEIAERNLELTVGGVLRASLPNDDYPPEAELADYEAALEPIASESVVAYRALVRDPSFDAYYQQSTPLDEIGALNIGSRPARRTGKATIDDLRAIPWVFAWTQSRQMVPGWFGAGRALTHLLATRGKDFARRMRARWPFFATLVDAIAVALATADLRIAREYVRLVEDEPAARRLFGRIALDHGRAVRAVLAITERPTLLAHQPTLARSIELRNPYVDPLSFIQVELLTRKRGLEQRKETVPPELERAILLTLNGVAAGLRNTG